MNKKHATHIITLGLVGPEMQEIQLHNHLQSVDKARFIEPFVEIYMYLSGGKKPPFRGNPLLLEDYDYEKFQDWVCNKCSITGWDTAIGLMEAVQHMVECAEENGNIWRIGSNNSDDLKFIEEKENRWLIQQNNQEVGYMYKLLGIENYHLRFEKFNGYFYAPNTVKAQTIAKNIFEMTAEAENGQEMDKK